MKKRKETEKLKKKKVKTRKYTLRFSHELEGEYRCIDSLAVQKTDIHGSLSLGSPLLLSLACI